MHHKLIFIALLLALAVGCSRSTSQSPPQTPADTPVANQAAPQEKKAPPPPPPASSLKTNQKQGGGMMSSVGVTLDSVDNSGQKPISKPSKSPEPQSPTPKAGMEIEKADVGSGDKGRGYGQGIITTPVATYFAARERIMFSVTVPDAIRAYKFEHDFKGPKSNEEFMEKVIKKNGIQLPTLPPGHRYIYDPVKEELMVEKPK